MTEPSLEYQLLVALVDREKPEASAEPFSIPALATLTRTSEAEVESAIRALKHRGFVAIVEDTRGGTSHIVAAELVSVPGRNAASQHQGSVRRFWESRGR